MAPLDVSALGEASEFDVVTLTVGRAAAVPHPTAARRLAWEIRKRTSIHTRMNPTQARLSDESIFRSPFLYWPGDGAFPPLSEAEIVGLRRFVELGGFVFIDDASPAQPGFDRSVRRALRRAFPNQGLSRIDAGHTVFRSFYLLRRPEGRVQGPDHFFGILVGDRLGVLISRHDIGGALARDNLGVFQQPVTPGGDEQRERAIRLGVNIVMYALCLDYKDDQVHAPFIMRRRGGAPRSE